MKPSIGAVMRHFHAIASRGVPAECAEPLHCETRQVEGLRSEARIGSFFVTVDEPAEFGGTGRAPNPAELCLAALGSSLEVTLRAFAEFSDVPVKEIRTEIDSKLDTRGFMGVDADIRSGFQRITIKLFIGSEAPPAELAALIGQAEVSCPVLEALRNPTEIIIEPHFLSGDER